MKSFTLEVITQEKHLLTETVTDLTIDTQMGQITILAGHIPLFARLFPGEMIYTAHNQKHFFAVTGGFIDVSPQNTVTVLADSALRSDKINLQEVEIAVANAQQALKDNKDKQASLKIELELRAALAKAKIARRHQTVIT